MEISNAVIAGVISIVVAIVVVAVNLYGKRKEIKIMQCDKNSQIIKKFNQDVIKAYDSVDGEADKELLVCQDTSKDYPRGEGAAFKNKIKILEGIVQYADSCIDEMVKNTFNAILDDMAKYHDNLCLINVLDCQSKGYQSTGAPYGTQTYQAAATQNAKNIGNAANAMMKCENLKKHWRSLYQSVVNKLK